MQVLNKIWEYIDTRVLTPEALIHVAEVILEIIVIFVLAKVAMKIVQKILERQLRPMETLPDTDPKKQRAKTLLPLLENIVSYVLYGLAAVLAIQRVGVDITAILAGAGVAGLAIGFGAQTLVKDLISGFFILFDGLIAVGDVITIDTHTGLVEKIGIRNTQIRKFTGELRTIPNGDLNSFGNYNRGFMRTIIPIGIAYEANIEDAMAVLRKIAMDWAAEHQDIVMEEPQVQGVMNFNSSDVEVRIVVKVIAGNQWQAERDIKRKLKAYFDDRNVEIPFPRHVVYLREEKEWSNVIDTADTPEEPKPEDKAQDKFDEFGVDKYNIGLVHQEVRRIHKAFKRFSGKLKNDNPSNPDSSENT